MLFAKIHISCNCSDTSAESNATWSDSPKSFHCHRFAVDASNPASLVFFQVIVLTCHTILYIECLYMDGASLYSSHTDNFPVVWRCYLTMSTSHLPWSESIFLYPLCLVSLPPKWCLLKQRPLHSNKRANTRGTWPIMGANRLVRQQTGAQRSWEHAGCESSVRVQTATSLLSKAFTVVAAVMSRTFNAFWHLINKFWLIIANFHPSYELSVLMC